MNMNINENVVNEEKINSKLKWYAIRTMAGKEKAAKENIEREIEDNKISKWINDIVLPTDKVYKLRNGKKFTRDKLVFPGYIFVQLQLIGEVERVIKRTKFVIGFTGDRQNRPIALKQKEIERIIGNMEKVESGDTEIPFMVGELVTIVDGPFTNFDGEVNNVDHDKQKLDVTVKIFGRETPVKLSYLQVDKLKL